MLHHFIHEFRHEADTTHKVLQAIPDSALDWKPCPISWTTAQLASHIANIYDWYSYTLLQDVLDMNDYRYDKGDISKAANIVAKFEENRKKAEAAMEQADESKLMDQWRMTRGEKELMAMPRIAALRSFLMNHLYHHRGEMIVYLRANGAVPPSVYGPTYEIMQAAQQAIPS